MIAEVPEAARQLAGELAEAFDQDRGLAEQLNAVQDRLRAANGRLWSGLHPDALGLVYDGAVVGQAHLRGSATRCAPAARRPRSRPRC